MFSPDSNRNGFSYKVPDWAPHVVSQEIDAGAKKLEPPSIIDIGLARVGKRDAAGVVTQWKTPYNRPAYESKEHIGYTKSAFQYIQQGRIDDAEKLLLQAHEAIRATQPTDLSHLIKSIENLAWVYFSSQKFIKAEPFIRELISHRLREVPPADPLLVVAVDQLAEIYKKTGRRSEATCLYQFFLAHQVDSYGRQSRSICPTLRKLAGHYLEEHKLIAAEGLLLRILYIYEPIYGRSSLEISTLLEQLSEVYKKQQRFDKAAEMLERLLHVLETIHGEKAIAVASCLLKLADLLSQVGMTSEAEPLYRRVISIYELSFGRKTAEISVSRKKTETLTKIPALKVRERSSSELVALDTIREIGRQVREKNAYPDRELGVIGV